MRMSLDFESKGIDNKQWEFVCMLKSVHVYISVHACMMYLCLLEMGGEE